MSIRTERAFAAMSAHAARTWSVRLVPIAAQGTARPRRRYVDLAEVEHERRARALPGDRHARRDADADLAELAVEDHAAVGRAVHERPEDRRRGRGGAGAPADVLAERPVVRAAEVAGLADAVG